MCGEGHDPVTFSFLFDWVGVLWPQLSKVLEASSFPQCPCSSKSSVTVRAAAYASDSGESLHCFLVGVNKSYVIATSDLRLFHSSFLVGVNKSYVIATSDL